MALTMIGRKLGMTRVFDEDNRSVPVTVIELGPNVVTQLRTEEKDGYSAVQLGFDQMKARNSTIPQIGHDAAAGSEPMRFHRETRLEEKDLGEFSVGQAIKADHFAEVPFVDVIGTSKGKGFAGTMKRYNFKGQLASHGVERKHRSPGSIGGHASNAGQSGKLKKGKRMGGHMGAERVTVRSLPVVRVDAEQGIMLVKGPVPGSNKSMVMVRPSVRLYKTKGKVAKGG